MIDKPTPTELKAMWQLHAADIGGIFDFARAVLAKWGQPAQARAGSVQEDAARYRHLRDCNSGSLAVMQITGTDEDDWFILTEDDADAAIDAARKQGAR